MRPWLKVAFAGAALGIASGAALAQEATSGVFKGHGIVKAVAPGTGWLTIAHDDILGFMPAMQMMYKVASRELSKGLQPGDEIEFKIDAAKYVIVEVNRVAPAK
jgi:Cu/Ag efflux protein CusF